MIAHLLGLLLSATPPSHVERVVVFPDRAQVTRAVSVPCQGHTQVTFEGLPPSADPKSFRAASRDATVEGVRSHVRTRDAAYAKPIADLEAKEEALQREAEGLSDAMARAQALTRLGDQFASVAVGLISRDLAVAKPDPKGWGRAFDLSLQANLDGASQAVDLNAKRRALGWQLEDVRAQLRGMQASAQRQEQLAEVLVSCPAGRRASVSLTYRVGGAGWSPRYQARADEAGGAVAFSTWATVTQRTGEDWQGAHLVLSTSVPSQDATPPELQPLKVYAEERAEEKKVLVRREERREHAQAGEQLGAAEAGGLAARAQGLSVQLEVPKAADVPGDGSPVRVFVGQTRMPARFAWRTAPTLQPFVFRVADLTNRAPYPLLDGPVEAFGHSGLVGRYALERVPKGGAFHLTFGVEDAVHVKRTVLEEVQRDTGLFKDNKRFRYGYRFELANYGARARTVDLRDRIPVSELEDIQVALDEGTTAGYRLEKEDGIVSWQVTLAPGQKRTFELAFHVDVPDDYDTGGL